MKNPKHYLVYYGFLLCRTRSKDSPWYDYLKKEVRKRVMNKIQNDWDVKIYVDKTDPQENRISVENLKKWMANNLTETQKNEVEEHVQKQIKWL